MDLFIVYVVLHMTVWAEEKEIRYRREFPGIYNGKKDILCFRQYVNC